MKKKSILKRVIYLFVFIFVVALFTACSAADSSEDWANDAVASAPESMESMDAEDGGILFESGGNVIEEGNALSSIPILLPSESGRQLAYTVVFNLETTEFMGGMRLLFETVGEMGGYIEEATVEGRSLRQPNRERHGDFAIRMPNERLSDFIMFIEENYNWVWYNQVMRDFTFAYERNIDNLEALREQEQRILDELDSDEYEDGDAKRDDLSAVRAQIRNLEESNIEIGRDVDYSDITIRLSEIIMPREEPEEEPQTFGERLQETFSIAGDTLLTALQILVLITVTLLPWGLMIALIVVPIVYVVKKRRKKNGKDEILGG